MSLFLLNVFDVLITLRVNNVTTQNNFYILSCDTILDGLDTISSSEKRHKLS